MLHPVIRSSLLSATLALSATIAGGCSIDDATRGLFASDDDGATSSTRATSGGTGGNAPSTASAGGAGGDAAATAGSGGDAATAAGAGGAGGDATATAGSGGMGGDAASTAGSGGEGGAGGETTTTAGSGGSGGETTTTAGSGGQGGGGAPAATSGSGGQGGEGGQAATTSSSTGTPAPTLDCGDITCPQGDGHACCFARMDPDRPSACVSGPPDTATCDEVGEGPIVTRIECQLPSHCGDGEICCGSTRRGYYLEISCQRECEPDDVRLCDPENPVCPRVNGERTVCRRSERLPDNYFICAEP